MPSLPLVALSSSVLDPVLYNPPGRYWSVAGPSLGFLGRTFAFVLRVFVCDQLVVE